MEYGAGGYFNLPLTDHMITCLNNSPSDFAEVNRTEVMRRLKYYSYGITLPAICFLGIVGNILNLVVLTRPTMRGPAYVYMRGYAVAALLAIVFALPFSSRILFHNEIGPWDNYAIAFYHAHLELFLGNACLGIGVFMLVALTVERYLAVCRLGQTRTFEAQKTPLVAFCLSLVAVALYLPYLFRSDVMQCTGQNDYPVYRKRENPSFPHSTLWSVYLWIIEVIFKMGPTLIIVHLNCCIIIVYRRTCAKRRRMIGKKPGCGYHSASTTTTSTTMTSTTTTTVVPSASGNERVSSCVENGGSGGVTHSEDSRRYWEEKRLLFLLGSTSILFFVCITPQLVLSLMIHEAVLESYPFQVFRAVANILELTNYSFTFYIYCLFSRDFRATLLQTLRIPRSQPLVGAQTCL